jgi:hypothetical protein
MRRLAPGLDENRSGDVAGFLTPLAELAKSVDIAVVVIHHRSTKEGSAQVRGSSAFEDQVDLCFAFDRQDDLGELRTIKFRIGERPGRRWFRFRSEFGSDGLRHRIESADPPAKPLKEVAGWRTLTGGQDVLDALADEGLSQAEIQRRSGQSEGTTGRRLEDLEAAGLAERCKGGWRRAWMTPQLALENGNGDETNG